MAVDDTALFKARADNSPGRRVGRTIARQRERCNASARRESQSGHPLISSFGITRCGKPVRYLYLPGKQMNLLSYLTLEEPTESPEKNEIAQVVAETRHEESPSVTLYE